MRRIIPLVLVSLILFSAACSARTAPAAKAGSIEIVSPYARTAMAEGNTGAFMLIRNIGTEADRLVGARYDGAMVTEIHETKMVDEVMKMSPVEGIDIPAKGQAELKPGGYHVMLMMLKQELKQGDTLTVTLTFEKAGEVSVTMKAVNP